MDGNGNGDLCYRADWSTGVKYICLDLGQVWETSMAVLQFVST
jgi:hypothetical protein